MGLICVPRLGPSASQTGTASGWLSMLPELLERLKRLETEKVELASQLEAAKLPAKPEPTRPERKFLNPDGPPLSAEEAARIRAEKSVSALPPQPKPEESKAPTESATPSPKPKPLSLQPKASSPSPSSAKPAICDGKAEPKEAKASAPEPSPTLTTPVQNALTAGKTPVVEKINSVTHRKEHAMLAAWHILTNHSHERAASCKPNSSQHP